MKFIHTADWHLGKLVHGVYMTEDQSYMLKQLVKLVEEEQPDCLVIAGDLYDRSVPPVAAVELLNEVLFTINVKLGVPIVAIGGNHDSAERLSFGSSWYQQSDFYLAGKLKDTVDSVNIKGVNFHLVPFAEPGLVKYAFNDDRIISHEEAMKAIIEKIEKKMNHNEPNVLVGHAFVLGGETTDSERILSVGGSGCVSARNFDLFDYTALGHLHSPDAISHNKIKYAGSLIKYSFSEAKQQKSVSIIEMNDNGTFQLERKSLMPLRDMREIEGYLDELLDERFYSEQKKDDYIKVTLLDEGALIDPINKLRQIYPNILHLERKRTLQDMKKKTKLNVLTDERKSELELFSHFYQEVTTAEFTEDKQNIIVDVIEKMRREGVGQ